MSKKVYIFLAEGFEEIESVTPIDVLRRAGIQVQIISVSDNKNVTGSHGITIIADANYTDVDFNDADLLVLPGGMPGTLNLKAHEPLNKLLVEAASKGKLIGAICAGPTVLAQNDLLKDKNATCYPGFEKEFTNANYTGEQVEVADKIITANGVGAAMKFALQLVTMLLDEKAAKDVAAKMVVK